jgi:signal transduction histidine kinase
MAKITYFASPERVKKKDLVKVSNKIFDLTYARRILNSIPNMVIIVNEFRQVIYANDVFIRVVGLKRFQDVLGQKPGELVKCIHSNATEWGCGTGKECRYCGAINTVLSSVKENTIVENEARITTVHDGKIIPLDLHIKASPFEFEGKNYTLVILTDIGDFKKREQMERIFIHDLLNSAWSLQTRADLFPKEDLTGPQLELFTKMKSQIDRIMDEVEVQRDILRMERHELEIQLATISLEELIESVVNSLSPLKIAKNKDIVVNNQCIKDDITTDQRILRRVLINLVKNALEASNEGESVVIECKKEKEDVIFKIKNSCVMTEEIRSQIFQRSFSTKGKGRGLGTYSVRILVDEYLKGSVNFESTEEKGTVFTVKLKANSIQEK